MHAVIIDHDSSGSTRTATHRMVYLASELRILGPVLKTGSLRTSVTRIGATSLRPIICAPCRKVQRIALITCLLRDGERLTLQPLSYKVLGTSHNLYISCHMTYTAYAPMNKSSRMCSFRQLTARERDDIGTTQADIGILIRPILEGLKDPLRGTLSRAPHPSPRQGHQGLTLRRLGILLH